VPSEIYLIETSSISDGVYLSGEMPLGYSTGYISLKFLNSSGASVVPTTGTVKFEGSEDGSSWGEIATIDATLVGAGVEYTRPAFAGPVSKVRATLSMISANAASVMVRIARYS